MRANVFLQYGDAPVDGAIVALWLFWLAKDIPIFTQPFTWKAYFALLELVIGKRSAR